MSSFPSAISRDIYERERDCASNLGSDLPLDITKSTKETVHVPEDSV